MKVFGYDIPEEVVDAIIGKAEAQYFFSEFLEELKSEWRALKNHKSVKREIEFRRKTHPEHKMAVRFEYHSDILEISYETRPSNVVAVILYVDAYDLRRVHEKLFEHIRKMYRVEFEEYYPVIFVDDEIVEFVFKPNPDSAGLANLVSDIKEKMPELEIELINNSVVRFKI